MGVEPKIGGILPTKMDGEHFMENPMNKWMIWGPTPILGNTQMSFKKTQPLRRIV